MKSKLIIAILFFVWINNFCKGQGITRPDDMVHYRIQLENRTNKHLKDVPAQLLEGYCKGLYKAYYPKAEFTEVNFGDFLSHFRWGEPLLSENIFCGDDYCSNPAFTELFSKFNTHLDYYEVKQFNKRTSLIERKVVYLQLVYTVKLNETEYTFKGPVFRMDEIGQSINIKNETNNSEPQSLKQVFDLARFYSVKIAGTEFIPENKNNKKADDYQEY